MRDRIRRLVCRWRGHRPQTLTSHEVGIRRSLTNCRRCSLPLDFDERHGAYPLPRERVAVER